MQFAFAIPLILGGIGSLVLMAFPPIDEWAKQLWRMAIATLIIGFLLHGVFDIYGSEAELVNVFFFASYVLFAGSILLIIFKSLKSKQK